ncbi:glycosyltransferase family 4 protein [Streptomyces sp. ID05-18]|uniref:glycosyltransferase family 4 protein n=1 Tax=Streptomyces sp. ID05-18 TaxID=3028662 RepID=UPI0029B3CC65|nr:glycosyltransferase family 4 protein [Streptomyces sp. ID05-18]MDX3491042.1 glycosyltransferase family 4 protein [Streptomyces sp. ID05-18]
MNSHVLYLALGSYRVLAAHEHVKRMAASGSRVVLAAPDTDEWADVLSELSGVGGVEIIRLTPDRHGSVQRSAKRLLSGRSGAAAAVDTIVAGDAQAIPTAWRLARSRPEVTLRMEPYDNGGRVPEPADLAVVTPWYPSPNNPYAGAFVKMTTRSIADNFDRVAILHTEDWSGRADAPLNDAIKITTDRLQERRELVPVLDTAEGQLLRVPVPLIHRKNYAPWLATQQRALKSALPTGRIEAPIVHAHAGIYGGVLAMRLARPDARIVVTEHATFLNKVFSQPAARSLYRDVLRRADAFLCVSTYLRDQIATEFPELAHKLHIVPNVIDFDAFPSSSERSSDLLSWLYVGRLVKHKGVSELLEAFAAVAEKEPAATLTMVGSGSLEGALRARGLELGLEGCFRIEPPVSPDQVNGLMHQHDLLVHASKIETFGMTIVEAVAAGLPVLVTRSHGPEETLAGIDRQAGALMDVDDDPQVIVDAYWELRSRVGELDLPAARESLLRRYGSAAVSEQLMNVYLDRPLPPAPEAAEAVDAAGVRAETEATAEALTESPVDGPTPGEQVGRAVLLALAPPKARRVAAYANHLVERGVHVTVVTAKTSVWSRARLDSRVHLVSIEKSEKKLRVPRGERFLVYRAPRAVLHKARAAAKKRRNTVTPEIMVAAVQRTHTKAADAFHKKVFNRGYAELRPQILSRIAKRDVVPDLRLDLTDHVFVCDVNSTVTGWKWAKAHPNLTVTTNLDRELYAPVEG